MIEKKPCVKCGKPVDEMQQYEAFIMDLPPVCADCQEYVSYFVARGSHIWPSWWHGGYCWSKEADRFIPNVERTG